MIFTFISRVEENMIESKDDNVIAVALAEVIQLFFPFGPLLVDRVNSVLAPIGHHLVSLCICKMNNYLGLVLILSKNGLMFFRFTLWKNLKRNYQKLALLRLFEKWPCINRRLWHAVNSISNKSPKHWIQ